MAVDAAKVLRDPEESGSADNLSVTNGLIKREGGVEPPTLIIPLSRVGCPLLYFALPADTI